MDKISKKTNLLLFFGIVSALLLVGGIPMIIVGAGKNVPIMIIGIIFTAFDFYACPILFASYGSAISTKNTVRCVMLEHIYSVKDIAVQTGKNEETVKSEILKALEKGYITGLLFDGERLVLNENKKAERRLLTAKCQSCGASVNYYADEPNPACPYCGTAIKPSNK